MYMGAFPVADFLDSDDIILISRDGVHMLQITAQAAGLGSGLKWWIETETDIYREYPSVDMGYASKVLVGEGQRWETMAYNFMDTYYSDVVIDTVCMMSGKKAYTQPVNRLNKIMARDYRYTETVDDCAPDISAETHTVYVDEYGKFPGDRNSGSRTGYLASITGQKSDNYPCIAIAGCDVYSISEEHLIKNFPGWTSPSLSRYTLWGLPFQAGIQDPHYDEYTVFANHELTSLGEKYSSVAWKGSWDPTPLEHHQSSETSVPASQWRRSMLPSLPNEGVSGSSGFWRRYAIDDDGDDEVPQKWSSFASINWSRENTGVGDALISIIDDTIVSGLGIIEAATDDKPAAINALLEAEMLMWWKGEGGHQPIPMSEAWKQINENEWQVDYYEVIFDVSSPFAFATKHTEPFVVACNVYGKNVSVDIHNVDDYTRNNEYTHYDQHSNLPYGSNINPISTWQVYYDPVHDPGGSSGNYRIDATRNNDGYWGRWTDDLENGTGIYDVRATMPFGLDYQQRNYVWNAAFFPTHRGWFDLDDSGYFTCKKGYRNTEYGSLNHHFSILDAEGQPHTYPDYVYNTDGKDHDSYNYLSFYHPGYGLYEYDYRIDTLEPSSHYIKDICAGKLSEDNHIDYDYSLGDHWIFNKSFLEANLVEHVFTDVDTYSVTYNVYDDDITHEEPNPTVTYRVNINTLKICKGYTSKLGSGQKAQNNARDCFAKFLKTSGIQALDPKFTSGGGGTSTTTSIGVNEQEGFWTGYTEEVDDDENPGNTKKVKHKQAWIDPGSGDINTEGTFRIEGDDIFDKLQRKLQAGEGISLRDDTATGRTIITNTMLDVALDIFADAVDCSYGLDFNKNGETLYFMLKHDITATPAGELPPGSIPVNVNRSYDESNNKITDHLSVDVSNLNIPTITTGHGIVDTGSAAQNQHIIGSTALDNIKVNGTVVQRQSNQEDGYFVDLDISGGGGGGEVEVTYPSPIPNYGKRQFINSFTAVSNTFTPNEDGYLFLEVRNSALFYVEVEIEGKSYTLGNMNIGTSAKSENDCSNMIPLMRGQKVTMAAKSSSPAISTSESATNANKFWFIPMSRQKKDSATFVNPRVVFGNGVSIASFTTSALPTSSGTDYILTPTADGVIISNDYYYIQPTAGFITICPLDENNQSLGEYRIFQIPGGSSGMRANQLTFFPVKKGEKYKIYKSSSSITTGAFTVYAFGTVNSANQFIAPFLDWHNAEMFTIQLESTGQWVDISAPNVVDRPGIMYIDGDPASSGNNGIYPVAIRCNSNNPINLTFSKTQANRNYCIMNAYNERSVSASLKWQYKDESNGVNPVKLVFVPFKKYTIPGIDYAMDNKYNILNNTGMLDLSDIFNRLEALEAEVFPE